VTGGTSHVATADLGVSAPVTSVQVHNGAAITFDHSQHLTTLDADGGRISLSPGGHKVIVCRYVTIAPPGTIDLGEGNMVLLAASTSSIQPLIAAGRVVATDDGGLHGLGVAAASQVFGITPEQSAVFAGETISGGDILVKYTYRGDANLDGRINVDDYGRIDLNAGLGTTGWFNGDFNFDGKVNIDDYGIIDVNIGVQGPPLAPRAGPASSSPQITVGTRRTVAPLVRETDLAADLLAGPQDLA
jgi:hypothetical protein